jgi:Helix-turn-helix domain
MSSPDRAVPRIPHSPAGNEPAWPQDQDTQIRKPPQRLFEHHADGNLTRDENAENDHSNHDRSISRQGLSDEDSDQQSPAVPGLDQYRLSDRNTRASKPGDSANRARSLGSSSGDPASKLFNFPLRERLMNAREVADRLGVSERWVRDHTTRRSPKIRAVKLGTLIRYRPADVDTFMDHLDTLRPSGQTRFGV